MVVFKPQMCFAGLLMTLAEKKRAGKRAGALPGSSPHPQDPGSCGAGRGVRAVGHRWTCCGEGDLGDTRVLFSHVPQVLQPCWASRFFLLGRCKYFVAKSPSMP